MTHYRLTTEGWVPHRQDPEAWKKYYDAQIEGRTIPIPIKETKKTSPVKINLVSEVQDAVDKAKAEIKHINKQERENQSSTQQAGKVLTPNHNTKESKFKTSKNKSSNKQKSRQKNNQRTKYEKPTAQESRKVNNSSLFTKRCQKMSGVQQNGESMHIHQLSLFQKPNIQDAVEREYEVEFRPAEQITDDKSPVIFNIPKQSRDFTDLNNCRLKMKLRLKHSDDTALHDLEMVSLTNFPHQSSWAEVAVYINGVRVSGNTSLFAYKAAIKAYMRHNNIADASFMKSMGWRRLDGNVTTNGRDICKSSRPIELEGRLFEDVFEIKRYLLNGMDIQIKLQPTPASFRINSSLGIDQTADEITKLATTMETAETAYNADKTDETKKATYDRAMLRYYNAVGNKKGYKLVLEDIVLKMSYVRVYPMVIDVIQEQLQQQPALYPFTRTDVKTVSIPTGQQQVYFDTIFDGVRPNKVVIGMISSSTMNGGNALDPTLFRHFNVADISVVVDGTLIQPKKMTYNDDGNMEEYISTYEDFMNMVKKSGYETPDMTPYEFSRIPIFVFALEPIIQNDVHNQVMKGPICVNARFASPLRETVNMVLYAEMPALMQVDAARNVAVN